MAKILRKIIITTLSVAFCIALCSLIIGCAHNAVDKKQTENPNPPISDLPIDNEGNGNSSDNQSGEGPDIPSQDISGTGENGETDDQKHIHTLEFYAAIDATCTLSGNVEYWYCAECDTSYADESATQVLTNTVTAAIGHSYTEKIVAPSCTDIGYTLHICDKCGDEYTDNELPATEHTWKQTETVKSPSCIEDGISVIVCSECGRESTQVIPAPGHRYEETVTLPTCTEQGSTLHVCSECGDEYTDSYIEELGHSYYLEVTDPTCVDNGFSTQKCHRCDIEIVDLDTVPATGHAWTENVTPPTCTDHGLIERVCKNCGLVESEIIPVAEHSYIIETTAPTCTEPGYTKYSCQNCDYEYVNYEAEATEHSYTETVSPPTCNAGGFTLHICTDCGDTYKDSETPAIDHTYSAEWSKDVTHHWHDAVCGCDVAVEKIAHTYVDGVCECGMQEPLPYQFYFILNDDGYAIKGIEVADGVEDGSLEIVLPSEYNDKTVTGIADNAYKDNTKIKSITIPKCIKKIGKNAFLNCSVTSVIFEKTSGWKISTKENGGSLTAVLLSTAAKNAQLLTKNTTTNLASYYWFCS